MPFVSQAQRRACWAKYHQAKKAGKKPQWDCPEWEAGTVKATMPPANTILEAKQDLKGFSTSNLITLARYYKIPINIKKQDLRLIIAIHNFLD